MIKHLTIFFILAASTSAQQVVSCRVSFTGREFKLEIMGVPVL